MLFEYSNNHHRQPTRESPQVTEAPSHVPAPKARSHHHMSLFFRFCRSICEYLYIYIQNLKYSLRFDEVDTLDLKILWYQLMFPSFFPKDFTGYNHV